MVEYAISGVCYRWTGIREGNTVCAVGAEIWTDAFELGRFVER